MSDVARVYVLLARRRRVGVVLRRGPSRYVEMLRWDLASDRVEAGQWIRARVYERRCDLTPNGDHLVYFAATNRGPLGSWTAVSRPPYFTALALFPNAMGCWGGGGLFADRNTLLLNHWPANREAKEGMKLPSHVRLEGLGVHAGRGEDDPIWTTRLIRDGWRVVQHGETRWVGFGRESHFVCDPPRVYAKACPRHPALDLVMTIRGLGETNGPWYMTAHHVVTSSGVVELGDSDWADWDENGDLLLAKDGALHRLVRRDGWLAEPALVADLRDHTFRSVIAPAHARRW